jgi:hypothetical protein
MGDFMYLSSPEQIGAPVVVVLAAQDIYMQRAPGCHCEGIEYVREHLRREITDLFALDTQVSHAIGTRADVDNCARKSLSSVIGRT